jgi:hypothetical protein
MPDYKDFDLHIWREGDRYFGEVKDSPAGASDRVLLRWPFGTEPHEVLLLKLENAILKGRGYRAGPISGEEKILRQFGAEVFKAVFRDSEEIARKFVASLEMLEKENDTGLRLNLRVDPPELAMLPWEYVFDESSRVDEYLCLKNRSPLVRFLGGSGAAGRFQVEGPLRVLGMIANPGGEWEVLDTEAERRRIDEALSDPDDIPPGSVHFRWVQGGTSDDLFNLMQRGPWHIFHFIGHGGTERYVDSSGEYRSEGYVVMEDGLGGAVKVSASHLGLTLEDGNVRLAVLNCCESARGTNFSSAGAALVKSGVPMVIAMQFAITDVAASRFAAMFYKSLIGGQTVEHALTVARRYMRLRSNVEWGIPVLFTRSGACVLFNGRVTPPDPVATGAALRVPTEAMSRRTQAQEEFRRLWERRS